MVVELSDFIACSWTNIKVQNPLVHAAKIYMHSKIDIYFISQTVKENIMLWVLIKNASLLMSTHNICFLQ